ncbi:MAG: hypothetical protein IJV63_06340 [Bacteroidales bacterium]|nr:hypothetical protein [Bacteroidales bacterium]MBQ9702592.1 hypothetical protein [Bacteroidales bacterium]
MKESYHICFTSHGEVLFRDEQDHGMFLNLMALRGYALQTEILAEAQMSNHVHLNIFTDRPMLFASQLRASYTKYFNSRWGRHGRFGEKYTYLMKVEGFNHQMVLQNYILRNGLHHGAAATAFGYKYCSVRDMFAKDIGLWTEKPASMTRTEMATYLPRRSDFPDHYRMNADGVFLRQSFMELRRAEQYYTTPRNFLFQMNRLTDSKWIEDQEKDKTGVPITLSLVERADDNSVSRMLNNEFARNFNRARLQDMDVCRLIDKELLPGYGVRSVYALTSSQKRRLAWQLAQEFRLPETQIGRCLP